jgi:hypothetical protein
VRPYICILTNPFNMKKIYVFIISGLAAAFTANAQTNPAPFDLSAGSYSFTEWSIEAVAGTYPANMVFHFTTDPTGNNYSPLAPGTQDFDCGYGLSARPRVNGLDDLGISMVSTGSGQYNDCVSGSNSNQRFMGAAVLALNTTGRTNVQVTWTGGTLTVGDGGGSTGSGIPRIFAFELQYRIGTEGDFIDIENAEYVTNEIDHSAEVSTTLPAECFNQAVVQVRWVYKQHESSPEGAQGTRPQLRLDDISVTSDEDLATGIDDNIVTTLTAIPNPSADGIFTLSAPVSGTVSDMMGRLVTIVTEGRSIDISAERTGHYILRTDEGQVIRLMK